MEIKVVEEEEKRIILEIAHESVAFANLLREALWEDKNVKEAAYIKEHPYLSEPKIFVEVSRGNAKNALGKAVARLVKKAKDFEEEFKKALKK